MDDADSRPQSSVIPADRTGLSPLSVLSRLLQILQIRGENEPSLRPGSGEEAHSLLPPSNFPSPDSCNGEGIEI